jgi:hypothetical protein
VDTEAVNRMLTRVVVTTGKRKLRTGERYTNRHSSVNIVTGCKPETQSLISSKAARWLRGPTGAESASYPMCKDKISRGYISKSVKLSIQHLVPRSTNGVAIPPLSPRPSRHND